MNYTNCPVCGYAEMPYAPVPYNICPCCSTEFGVDDREANHQVLRQAWIKAGMPWFDDITSSPQGWSASLQLINAGYGSDLIMPIGSVASRAKRASVQITARNFWSVTEVTAATPVGAAA